MDSVFYTVITPAVLAMLFIQLLKWIWRKFVVKNPDYDFPPNFYKIAIPTFNVLLLPLAAFLDPSSNSMPTDWVQFVRVALVVLINSLTTVFVYDKAYKPMVDYGRVYKLNQTFKKGL